MATDLAGTNVPWCLPWVKVRFIGIAHAVVEPGSCGALRLAAEGWGPSWVSSGHPATGVLALGSEPPPGARWPWQVQWPGCGARRRTVHAPCPAPSASQVAEVLQVLLAGCGGRYLLRRPGFRMGGFRNPTTTCRFVEPKGGILAGLRGSRCRLIVMFVVYGF